MWMMLFKLVTPGKIIGGLAVAAALAFTIQSARLTHAKADLADARAALIDPALKRPWRDLAIERQLRLTAANDNNRALSNALAEQNASVAAVATESARTTALAAVSLAAARKASDAASENAATIMRAKPGASNCESAFLLMKGARK